MNDLHKHLRATADAWAKLGFPALMERFVLRVGQEFQGGPLPKGYRRGQAKACFENTTNLIARKTSLRYVEGYVMRHDIAIPIHHAWAIDADNRVIDLTIDRPAECQYMGVVMSRAECWMEMQRIGVYGVLDTGRGLNADWMFERAPDLKEEVEAIWKGRVA